MTHSHKVYVLKTSASTFGHSNIFCSLIGLQNLNVLLNNNFHSKSVKGFPMQNVVFRCMVTCFH